MPSLFDPIKLGAIHAPNRILMAPLTRGRATRAHVPTDLMKTYYSQRADAGLILTQSRGSIPGVYLQKLLLGGATAERVKVRGRLGAFIAGDHAYLYESPSGRVHQDQPLLAGPTLVWTGGGRVYRLEAAARRRKVLQIAQSVAP